MRIQNVSRSGGWQGTLWVLVTWALVSCPCLGQTDTESSGNPPRHGHGLPRGAIARFDTGQDGQQSQAIGRLQFSPDGTLLASSNQEELVQVWDVPSGNLRYALPAPDGTAALFTFSPGGKYLVTGSATVPVRIWDAMTGTLRSKITSPASELRYCHDGSLAVVTPSRITFYDTATAKQNRHRSPRLVRGAEFLSLSPTGNKLIAFTSRRRQSLVLHDLITGSRRSLPSPDELLKFATFRPDGQSLAIGNWPGKNPSFRVSLLDLQPASDHRYLEGHGDVVEDLVYSRDQRFAATASWDGTVRIWELLTGKTILSLQAAQVPVLPIDADTEYGPRGEMPRRHQWSTSHVTAVAISGDGRHLAMAATGRLATSMTLWPFYAAILNAPEVDQQQQDSVSAEDDTAESSGSPEELWRRMASPHPRQAYAAVGRALIRPAAQAYIAQRLQALLAPVSSGEIQQLIRDLDHNEFEVREAAFQQLVRMRGVAKQSLRAAMTGSTSLEQRLRIQRLLTRELPQYSVTPVERLRLHRLVFLLERLGDDQARGLLTKLVNGHPDRRVTRAAQAALGRIAPASSGSVPHKSIQGHTGTDDGSPNAAHGLPHDRR